jgi:hypothetical protein
VSHPLWEQFRDVEYVFGARVEPVNLRPFSAVSCILTSMRETPNASAVRVPRIAFLFYQRSEGVKKFRRWLSSSAIGDLLLQGRFEVVRAHAVPAAFQMP